MDPETKQLCKAQFPDASKGHFDIYSCFLSLGSRMLTSDGKLGFIIPNKFLSSRYAKKLRDKYLRNNQISQIVDFSHQNVFQSAVYPIILILDNQNPSENLVKIARADTFHELEDIALSQNLQNVNIRNYLRTRNRTIYLLEPEQMNMIDRIISQSNAHTLGQFIRFRWAISFHRKGLRELFVSEVPRGTNPVKFLGGKAFGGNREINRYNINWKGYWIDYDQNKAKKVKNKFPDISYFNSSKIIICQHALRMRATIDYEGYACKDIFMIGHLNAEATIFDVSLEYILALLNSELYSFLYSNIYSSTEIMGKYLHYLPMYLHDLPFILPSATEKKNIEKLVKTRLTEQSDIFTLTDRAIDNIIYEIYNCNKDEIKLAKTHIRDYLVK